MSKFFFVFIVLFTLNLGFSQQDSIVVQYDDSNLKVEKITKDDLETYKNDRDFNYQEEIYEENIIEKFQRWFRNVVTKFFEAIFGVGEASGILYFIFNVLPYLLLAFLVFLLVKFFLKVNSRNIVHGEKALNTMQFSEEENIIKNEDINALINEAIKQKNYRLAIRYYYLQTLKFLSDSNKISWQAEKTNEDYIKELKESSLLPDFKNLTRIYDYVWYGEFGIDDLKFNNLKTTFENVNNTLKN